MSRIKRLPDHLVNQIAAGEVVERPASVLKELLENAIDAGAGRVSVDLKDSGRRLLRVVDDGVGMTPEELELSLERHATSKIASEADLQQIRSLGFRGEALPAICAVSRFSLMSRARGAARGAIVKGEGGEIRQRGAVDCSEGTTVEIADLFFNTPARLKFLKSPHAELAAALRVATQLALAQPALHLRVTHNERVVLTAPKASSLSDRVGALLGYDLAGRLLEVKREERAVAVRGVVGPPALARGYRDDMILIVNGRPVRDTQLLQTLLEAYRPLLARDQFPVAVLALELPPTEVDVNVHPTKAWVRFRQPRLVQELVFAAVQEALRAPDVVSSPRPIATSGPAAEGAALPARDQPALFKEAPAGYAPSLFGAVVGQLQDTFVVAANEEEVFFVDQHVAHERVLFERLKADLATGPLPSQDLLFPLTLELGSASLALLEEWAPALTVLGFDVQGFGGATLLLRAVPALLKGEEPRRLLEALVDEVGSPPGTRAGYPRDSVGHGGAAPPLVDRALAFVACRAAIKAHAPLDREEMARLLADLSHTETPYFCPHGRPIVSRLSLREIKRELKRTW
ncbi:MAG: DNA mismatch repair endonuclease MutL [Candidatus Rokubacteria bacterium]|nr:DNA mismatch repair endonuclease MutL [Candidatus Rokubacteria bacterium]